MTSDNEIQGVSHKRIGIYDFFFAADLTEERKGAIILWVNGLSEDHYKMLREFLDEQEMDRAYNEGDG